VAPATAGRWIAHLLTARAVTPDLANTIVQLGAMTGDPARDVPDDLRERAAGALIAAGIDIGAVVPLSNVVAKSTAEAGRAFGESLPEGLRLDTVA
jgi:hypothetical protein